MSMASELSAISGRPASASLMASSSAGTGAEESSWVSGTSATGTVAWDFAIQIPSGVADAYLPPSASTPWRLEVSDGGYLNRSGRIEQFQIVWHSPSGDQVYPGAPLPQPTLEGQTVILVSPGTLTSVEGVPTLKTLSAAPSPVGADGTVSFVAAGRNPGDVRVFDLEGRNVARVPFAQQGTLWVARWNLSDGSRPTPRAGVYFARAGQSTARIVVVGP